LSYASSFCFNEGGSALEPESGVDWLAARFGRASLIAIFIFVMGSSLSGLSGTATGETEKTYLVFSDAPNVAVIRIYGDKIVAVLFDRKTKVLTGQAIVRKLDKEDLKLTLEKNIGPLARAN
jgi:hypothetical protein